ncbi:MAG: hypothetical protein IPN20_15880 [Haliscomenobacter sp.]|nr:hypothetical protein [Haliscomenobacter sp.]
MEGPHEGQFDVPLRVDLVVGARLGGSEPVGARAPVGLVAGRLKGATASASRALIDSARASKGWISGSGTGAIACPAAGNSGP